MNAGQQAIGTFVTATGTDIHQTPSGECRATAAALAQHPAVRRCDAGHARQLACARLAAAG